MHDEEHRGDKAPGEGTATARDRIRAEGGGRGPRWAPPCHRSAVRAIALPVALAVVLLSAASCGGTLEDEAVRSAYDKHTATMASRPADGTGGTAVRPPSPPRPLPPSAPPVDPQLEAARTLFEEGLRAFESDDWTTAVEKFEATHRLSPRAVVLFNIAVCHERLGDIQSAIGAYQRYLGEDPDMPEVRRQEVLEKIRALEEQIGIER